MTTAHSSLSSLQALPDGEAELQLVVHLRWEDLAALGREASRLAVRMQRPVGLDEAATHHLRSRLAAPAAPAPTPEPAAPTAAPIAITAGHTAGHTQQAQQPVSTGAHAAVAEHSARVSSLAGRAQQDQTPAAG
ncbi:hypothetical protein ACFXJ5_03315 [Streptomyces sp. NPDC059373]